MEEIFLRGHHIKDFSYYLRWRDEGISHKTIVRKDLEYDRPLSVGGKKGESFERHTNEVFRRIYENEVDYVIFVDRPDEICCGPRGDSPENWCGGYSKGNCKGNSLTLEDRFYIWKLGHLKISVKDFLKKIRDSTDYWCYLWVEASNFTYKDL